MVATAASLALPTGTAAQSGFYDGNVTLVGGYAGATTPAMAQPPGDAEEHRKLRDHHQTERGSYEARHALTRPPLGGMRLAR